MSVCLGLAAGALLSGCVASHQTLVLDTVGPAPARLGGVHAGKGSLLVFSAYDVRPAANYEESDTAKYSSYKILSPDGKLVKRVYNSAGTSVERPQQIQLPAGKYDVVAEADRYGRVTVPVLIAANQITVVHLERDGFWPLEPGFNPTNTVRLPGGQIVGWRALTAQPEYTAIP